jgi:hypothetical protein
MPKAKRRVTKSVSHRPNMTDVFLYGGAIVSLLMFIELYVLITKAPGG